MKFQRSTLRECFICLSRECSLALAYILHFTPLLSYIMAEETQPPEAEAQSAQPDAEMPEGTGPNKTTSPAATAKAKTIMKKPAAA